MRDAGALLRALPDRLRRRPNPDVSGTMLDALEHRVGDRPQALVWTGHAWHAVSYDGEASADGDTMAELLSNFLPQLPLHPA